MRDDFELYSKVGLINDVIKVLQEHQREWISEREMATRLGQPIELVIKIFNTLGVVPRSWSAPELYAVEDLLESCTRVEISARFNR
jgi:hypothetical protein